MTAKCIIRVLDAAGQMLGWVEHAASVRGDGCLRASGTVQVRLDVTGAPAWLSVHWCEMHVEARAALTMASVSAGSVVAVAKPGEVLLVVGPMPGPLPPVTVGSVSVVPPTGGTVVAG